jgi:tryptophan synthase alpha chain
MSRLESCFAGLRSARRPGLVTYVTAGDPDIDRSAGILRALDAAGADVLEVGVPFSDPMADGPVIQRATERALAGGTTLARTLDLIACTRASIRAPIVLFTYANPVLRMGVPRFIERAAEAGVDGVLTLDLPIEEAGPLDEALTAGGMDTIFLLSPTTTDTRIARAAERGRGFLYCISRLGVTGVRQDLAEDGRALVGRIRRLTTLPVAVGFGISGPEHVAEVAQWADAAVVGSALVAAIASAADGEDVASRAGDFVRWLKGGAA